MTTLRTPLCDVLGIEWPILQAPMGGATTVDLVAQVSDAGALGGFGHAHTDPDVMRQDAAAVRARTRRPFAINLFVAPMPDEPPSTQQREAIEAMRGHLEHLGLPVPDRVPPPYAPDCMRQIDAILEIRPAVFTAHLVECRPVRCRGCESSVSGSGARPPACGRPGISKRSASTSSSPRDRRPADIGGRSFTNPSTS